MNLLIFFFKRGCIAFLLTFVLFSLIRTKYFKESKIGSNGTREFLLSIFIAYIAVLFVFMFTPNVFIANKGIDLTSENFDFVGNFKDRIDSGSWGVNIHPFRTILSYIKYSGPFHCFTNIVGNILIFMPITFLLPMIYENTRKLWKIILISISISVFIEFVQFFIGRSVDIDDLILNVVGGIFGYLLFKFLEKKNFKITKVAK